MRTYQAYKGKDAKRSRGRVRPIRNYQPYHGGSNGSWARRLLAVLLVLVILGIVAFGALLGVVLRGNRDHIDGDPQLMVILGCQVKDWGPSILLQDRLDTALAYLEDHPDMTVVVSGGQGEDEPMSEAACMRDYLVEHDFPAEQILLEDQSHNTLQNLRYSYELLQEQGYGAQMGQMLVVSNGFHLARVRLLFGRVWDGSYTLSTLAAPASHVPTRLAMYIREPVALVKSFLFDR